MKGITGNPAADAYQRMAVKPVSAPNHSHGAQGSQAKPATTEAAKVSISAEAQSLATSEGQINTPKVESLKASISDGSFRVDSNRVAQLMLERGA